MHNIFLRGASRTTLVVVALVSWCSSLAAQLAVQIDPTKLNENFARFIGQSTLEAIAFARRGERLATLIKIHCGPVHELYWVALNTANPGKLLKAEDELPDGTVVNLPSCIPAPSFEVARSKLSDKPFTEALQQLYSFDTAGFADFKGVADLKGASSFSRRAKIYGRMDPVRISTTHSSNSPMIVYSAEPGDDALSLFYFAGHGDNAGIALPTEAFSSYSDAVRILNPDATLIWNDTSPTPTELLVPKTKKLWMWVNSAGPKTQHTLASLTSGLVGVGVPKDQIDPEEFEHYNEVTSARELGDACTAGDGLTDEAQRVRNLIFALVRNRAVLKQAGRVPKPPTVTIVDSGVYTSSGFPFWFRQQPAGLYLGMFDTGAPHVAMEERAGHGTRVAALAIGGPQLVDLLNATDYLPQLLPINMYARKPEPLRDGAGMFILGPNNLPQNVDKYPLNGAVVLNALSQSGGGVVNLSIGRTAEIKELKKLLQGDSATIFVVAAGNSGASLVAKSVYPAKYGGQGNPGEYNLLTVAATAGDGKLAKFSNHSLAHVDIAAPGCAVESISYNAQKKEYRKVRTSGTSFAAPQVTATVALLRGITGDLGQIPAAVPAAAIRMHVLIASDRHKHLQDAVQDGRVLNTLHAVSTVFFEGLLAGGSPMKYGEVVGSRSSALFCKSAQVLPEDAKVLRFIRDRDAPTKFNYEWTDKQLRLRKGSCDARSDGHIAFVDDGAEEARSIEIDTVADLTFAMFPVRELPR